MAKTVQKLQKTFDMKHLIGSWVEKNISGLPPAKIFICNTGLRTGSVRLSSGWAGDHYRLHFSNWVRLSQISARADIASLVLSLSPAHILSETSPLISPESAFNSLKFILIKNNL